MDMQKAGTPAATSWQPELVLTLEQIDNFVAHLKEKNTSRGL